MWAHVRVHLPAAVAEHEKENTEDDASDSNVDADDDASSRGFTLLLFQTVTRSIQHCAQTEAMLEHNTYTH